VGWFDTKPKNKKRGVGAGQGWFHFIFFFLKEPGILENKTSGQQLTLGRQQRRGWLAPLSLWYNAVMTKSRNPLFSLNASGTLSKCLTFLRRRKQDIIEKKPEPFDAKTALQLDWRHMFLKVVALWNALSAADKQDWESQARSRHMTGYAWFVSQALRPNPGIYLPLQGGTMQGNIDMAKYRLLRLPPPVDAQEPLRVQEYYAIIAPYLYHEGARVYRDANQSIPHNTWTGISFAQERWDTDNIHSTTVNTSHLTCRTAGKYLIIGNVYWSNDGAGYRHLRLYLNGATVIAYVAEPLLATQTTRQIVSTIYDLAVDDFVQLRVLQTSGGALPVVAVANYSPEFMMERIGV